MGRLTQPATLPRGQRVDWVDYAKGFCIVFVVMMHSTLGVENAAGREGWMHAVVDFAKPFRMPDFFLISGLFLAQVIDRDWRTYLDRKVVHFVYFYVLWTAIQFAFKAPLFVQEHGVLGTAWLYVESFWEPFGTLWFIYLLPIFFVVTKLAHSLRVPPMAVWLVAAALEIAHIHTGATVIDEFASRFIYFYSGYLFAPRIFALAARWREFPEGLLAGLATWGLINGLLVFHGFADLPFVSLALGFAGAGAVVAVSVLLSKTDLAAPLRYCGRELDRHLPRVLPADGREPHGAAQDRADHRYRHHLGAGHDRRRGRRTDHVLGRAAHVAAVPVRAAGTVLDRAQSPHELAARGSDGALTPSRRARAGRNSRQGYPRVRVAPGSSGC